MRSKLAMSALAAVGFLAMIAAPVSAAAQQQHHRDEGQSQTSNRGRSRDGARSTSGYQRGSSSGGRSTNDHQSPGSLQNPNRGSSPDRPSRDNGNTRTKGWNGSNNRDNNRYNGNRDRNSGGSYGWSNDGYRGGDRYRGGGYSGGSYNWGYRSSRNDWRDLAIGAGFLNILGLLEHDDTLCFVGSVGELYAVYRYDEDLRSSDPECRARAYYFSQPYFYRDGIRYDRRMVERNGDEYYQFCRE